MTKFTSTWENPMVRKMSTDEFIAWRTLYTKRLDHLRAMVIQTMRDAREGLISEEYCELVVTKINEEVNEIIECGMLINILRNR